MSSPTTTTLLESFRLLAISEGLAINSEQYRSRRRAFITEEVKKGFVERFGANENDLRGWKRLLSTIGVEGSEDFTSITQCRKALKGKFINIVDLVDAANMGKTLHPPNPFPTAKELGAYIWRTKKIFPLEEAKSNRLLKQFLIVVGGQRRA